MTKAKNTLERNMNKLTSTLADETEELREAYAALNRNDIRGFAQILDPQIPPRLRPNSKNRTAKRHGS